MISSKEIFLKWEGITKNKANLSFLKCFLLAILAGMYIALGGVGATLIQSSAGAGLNKLLGACVFPAGLIMVVMAGGELFTGNCLMAGQALCGKAKWTGVLRNWLIVYFGNLVGAVIVSLIAVYGGILTDASKELAMSIAENKGNITFMNALLKGIGCNVLVCAAVWMASGADNAGGKAVLCFFPVMLFVLCGMEHSIANMYYLPTGMLLGAEITVGQSLVNNLLPVTLGNIIGGAGLAAVYTAVHHTAK